jgi:hypothetical protein
MSSFNFCLLSNIHLILVQVNVVDGLKEYEKLFDDLEVQKLVSLVNDLKAAGKRGQFQGKFTNAFSFIGISEDSPSFCFSFLYESI